MVATMVEGNIFNKFVLDGLFDRFGKETLLDDDN